MNTEMNISDKLCVGPCIVAKINCSGNEHTAIYFNSVARDQSHLYGKYTLNSGLLHWVDETGKRWVAPASDENVLEITSAGYQHRKSMDSHGVRPFYWDARSRELQLTTAADHGSLGSGEYIDQSIPFSNVVPALQAVLKLAR